MHFNKLLPLFLLLFTFVCTCKNDDDTFVINNLPEGAVKLDNSTSSNCNLPKCSPGRVSRVKAEQVNGIINENFDISTVASFDTHVLFLTCDLDSNYRKPGMHVRFSGEAKDACGIMEAIPPLEEVFIIHLIQIDSI